MWFLFSVITLLCWSGSDLFSKLGCRGSDDAHSHLRMVIAVGAVMGLHAAWELLVQDVPFSAGILLMYLPVSLLYIVSMAVGYLGLRYIELSISSPVCNSSGAIVAVLILITRGVGEELPGIALWAVALVCAGVIGLGVTEAREDPELRAARQDAANFRYSKSVLALLLPLIYCLLDALGTFADSIVLGRLGEELAESANCAYELTFAAVGAVSAVYLFGIKRERPLPHTALPRFAGAVFETAGQLFYVYALADTAHAAFAAPIISAYCAVSVIWGRVFLKEKLSGRHYACLAAVLAGVVILGVLDL